jgi:hypothetical protein
MPKDTVWLDTKGNYILFDSNVSIIIDSDFFSKNIVLQDGQDVVNFCYTGKNSPKADSILRLLMTTQTGDRKSFYKAEKNKFDALGDKIVILLLLGMVILIAYAIKKKNEYTKDPDAAEAKGEWEEIGTSNNYDTTGNGMDGGGF